MSDLFECKTMCFGPSSEMLKAFKLNFTNESLASTSTQFATYMNTLELTSDNVSKVFTTLLSIEDIISMQPYEKLMHSNHVYHDHHRNEFYVNLNNTTNGAEDVLNPFIDEVVLVSASISLPPTELYIMADCHLLGNVHKRHVGKITMVKCKRVWFNLYEPKQFPNDPLELRVKLRPEKVLNKSFQVIFRSPRTPFNFMYNALKLLANCSYTRQYLYPISNSKNWHHQKSLTDQLKASSLLNESIATNPEQLTAVRQILAGPDTRAPFIVFGPPGK